MHQRDKCDARNIVSVVVVLLQNRIEWREWTMAMFLQLLRSNVECPESIDETIEGPTAVARRAASHGRCLYVCVCLCVCVWCPTIERSPRSVPSPVRSSLTVLDT